MKYFFKIILATLLAISALSAHAGQGNQEAGKLLFLYMNSLGPTNFDAIRAHLNENPALINQLIEDDQDKNKTLMTPLTYAIKYNKNRQLIKMLVEEFRANVNQALPDGRTPLFMALSNDTYSDEIAKLLQKNGAFPLNMQFIDLEQEAILKATDLTTLEKYVTEKFSLAQQRLLNEKKQQIEEEHQEKLRQALEQEAMLQDELEENIKLIEAEQAWELQLARQKADKEYADKFQKSIEEIQKKYKHELDREAENAEKIHQIKLREAAKQNAAAQPEHQGEKEETENQKTNQEAYQQEIEKIKRMYEEQLQKEKENLEKMYEQQLQEKREESNCQPLKIATIKKQIAEHAQSQQVNHLHEELKAYFKKRKKNTEQSDDVDQLDSAAGHRTKNRFSLRVRMETKDHWLQTLNTPFMQQLLNQQKVEDQDFITTLKKYIIMSSFIYKMLFESSETDDVESNIKDFMGRVDEEAVWLNAYCAFAPYDKSFVASVTEEQFKKEQFRKEQEKASLTRSEKLTAYLKNADAHFDLPQNIKIIAHALVWVGEDINNDKTIAFWLGRREEISEEQAAHFIFEHNKSIYLSMLLTSLIDGIEEKYPQHTDGFLKLVHHLHQLKIKLLEELTE